jgi:hypothetical protein
MDGTFARSTLQKVVYALVGVGLGSLGIGWHGRPTDSTIVDAIRRHSPAYTRAAITLVDVDRDWVQEVFGLWDSQFLASATVAPPGGPVEELCFGIEPGPVRIAIAFGPYAAWRCDYPF